ncbi:MAG: hypothetical protein AAGC43_02175 [Bacteroidota bacterium]
MKKLIFSICFMCVFISYGQTEFAITESGLSPKYISAEMNAFTASQLYTKTMGWIAENSKKYKLSVDQTNENVSVHLSYVKGNAVILDKQYYNVDYKVKIHFGDGKYSFEPAEIRLKLNSKYDMGWKDFDLTDGASYFKKGKPLRKYRSYIENLTKALNEVQLDLFTHLKSTEN